MNVVILGDSNVTLIREYCENVLIGKDNICILSYTNKGVFSDFYKKQGIRELYVKPYTLTALKKTNVLQEIYRVYKTISEQLPFDKIDVFHVHYVEASTLVYLAFLWLRSKRRVLTFWGSDILRISKKNKKLLAPFLISASTLTFMIEKQYEIFKTEFCFWGRGGHRIKIIDTGSNKLNVLDDVCQKRSKYECKSIFEMMNDRILIHIGYSKDVEQQHLLIIESFMNLSQTVIDKIQVVFPWQYGINANEEEYIQKIKLLCKQRGIEHLFAKDFLVGEKLAIFRNSANIFVYGQSTDAMSDTPLEYLYSGSLFFCPQWLEKNYQKISKNKCFITYSDFEELPTKINELIMNNKIKPIESECLQIKKEIYEIKSWEKLKHWWRKCYE